MKFPEINRETVVRFAISTAETFVMAFFATFFVMLDTSVTSGQIDLSIAWGIVIASAVAAAKVVAKSIREAALAWIANNSEQDGE